MFWKSLVFACLLAGAFAQFELSDDQKEQVKNSAKSYLEAQCKKAGAEDKIEEVANATHAFINCMKGLVDVETIKKEIEDAKPKGALDEVFKKYCAKTPEFKTCIHTVLDGVSPCLDEVSREQLNPAKNGTDQLIDFVCHKDGDRIALLIAEKGPECFTAKANTIRSCLEATKGSVSDADTYKSLTLADKCAKFDQLSSCIVTALEGCDTPTPANMAESLFRYVRKGSPCNTALPKN